MVKMERKASENKTSNFNLKFAQYFESYLLFCWEGPH